MQKNQKIHHSDLQIIKINLGNNINQTLKIKILFKIRKVK